MCFRGVWQTGHQQGFLFVSLHLSAFIHSPIWILLSSRFQKSQNILGCLCESNSYLWRRETRQSIAVWNIQFELLLTIWQHYTVCEGYSFKLWLNSHAWHILNPWFWPSTTSTNCMGCHKKGQVRNWTCEMMFKYNLMVVYCPVIKKIKINQHAKIQVCECVEKIWVFMHKLCQWTIICKNGIICIFLHYIMFTAPFLSKVFVYKLPWIRPAETDRAEPAVSVQLVLSVTVQTRPLWPFLMLPGTTEPIPALTR